MKKVIARVSAFTCLLLALDAAAQHPQVSLAVRKKQDTDTDQKATRSSLTKEQDRVIELAIQLRNNDPKEQTVTLSWYFIGNPVLSGYENFVYDKGEMPVTLAARTLTNLTQTAKAIGSKTYTSRHRQVKAGAKPLGYVVTLMQETNLLAVAASPLTYDRVVRDPEAFAKLLAAPAPPEP